MMSQSQASIQTPLSVIIQIFQKRQVTPLIIHDLDKLNIRSQLNCLDPASCNSKICRKYVSILSVLCNKNLCYVTTTIHILSEQIVSNNICICHKIQHSKIIEKLQHKNKDLSSNAFKRIRLKSILCKYYKHWYLINATNFSMIQNWSVRDITLSVIVHCIKNDKEEDDKKLLLTWKFLSFLVEFIEKHNYNGTEFIAKYIEPQQAKSGVNDTNKAKGGFGLMIVKEICKEYDQRTGKYVKVKKQLSVWGKMIMERYQQEINNEDEDKDEDEVNNKDNNKWFWYCDEGGKIEWIPYKDEHQKIINDAFFLNDKKDVIIMQRFKIEFEKEDDGFPAGQQYDYKRHNSWRRPIIYGQPNESGLLNDIFCRELPK